MILNHYNGSNYEGRHFLPKLVANKKSVNIHILPKLVANKKRKMYNACKLYKYQQIKDKFL